jgi:hypothetical protein
MSNQLKLLFYIVFVGGALFYFQDRFDFLDISLVENKQKKEEVVKKEKKVKQSDEENFVLISTGDQENIRVDVEIADTPVLRGLGLSNRKYLGDYNGMLFIFEEKGNSPFWMKDTFINLDIMFIDEDRFIVDIKENNEPCTEEYCPQILSTQQYKYVLEVKGGFSQINGVKEGQSLTFHLASSN